MDIPWLYAVLAIFMLGFGLDILIRRRGGLQVWTPPFGYKTRYYRGKPARIVGIITSLFGFVFTLDALRSLVVGSTSPVFTCTFCAGSLILIFSINIFARPFAKDDDSQVEQRAD